MGAAVSSNTAKSIAKVSNNVSNSTDVSAAQVNAVQQQIDFDDCFLMMSGDINIESASQMVAKSKQIVTAMQQSHIQNTIAQQMMQQAKSQTGFLGVGFAEANNYASQMTDATSNVLNQLTTVANQFNYIDQGFRCEGSTFIGKNFLLSQGSSANFFSEQVVKNTQISSIANDITQSITQKATATVSGMSAFLLIFVLLIAACGYVLSKPLSSGSGKIIIGTVMVVGIGLLIAVGFIFAWPPLFQKPNLCALTPMPFMPKTCKDPCINATKQTINVRVPTPFKFPIFDVAMVDGVKNDGAVVGSLAGMAIANVAKGAEYGNNMGMNASAAQTLIESWNNFWMRSAIQGGAADVCLNIDGTKYCVNDLLSKSAPGDDGSIGDALAPMFVPTDSAGNLYEIPSPYMNTTGTPCQNVCGGLAFTLTGIVNPTTLPTGSNPSSQFTPPSVCATKTNANITAGPTGTYSKSITPRNGDVIYAICPTLMDGSGKGKPVKDPKTGNPLACGCTITSDPNPRAQYLPLTSGKKPINIGSRDSPWLQNQQAGTLKTLLAESTSQADVRQILSEWPPQDIKSNPGWLARFVRTFYYQQLDLMSTCYWEDNDLVYANLQNVTNLKTGKRVPNMDGNTWLTAYDAGQGQMQRFVKKNGGGWELDPTIYKFDKINTYKVSSSASSGQNIAIDGMGKPGDYVDINGMFGICNDRTYQFGQFAQRIGIYIAIGIVVIAILFVMLDHGIGRAHGASFENPEMVAASSGGKGDGEIEV